MSFTIAPKEGPRPVAGALNPTPQDQGAMDKRARAIARLTGQNPDAPKTQQQSAPVQNPTQVGIEELGALKVPSHTPVQGDEKGRLDTVEGTAVTSQTSEATQADAQQPPKTSEGQPLSDRFAQLARKEKALRIKELELKRREADSVKATQSKDTTLAQTSPDLSKYISRDDLKNRPFEVLAELGLTYDDLTEQAANAPTPDQVAQQRYVAEQDAKIKALEARLEAREKREVENEQSQYDTALRTIKTDVSKLVKVDDNFETIRVWNAEQDVVDLIVKCFKDGLDEDTYPKGTLLSVEEAAQMVEEHLSEATYERLSKSKKLQSRLQPKAPAPAAQQEQAGKQPAQQNSQQPIRTLTNAVGSTKQYSMVERAKLAAQYGPNWREKVGA